MSNLAFVDIETTGLDPEVNQVMEVAILTEPYGDTVHISVPFNPGFATEQALAINKYYERQNELLGIQETRADAAGIIFDALQGHIFVGNNPQFDANFLKRFLKNNGYAAPWHYHLVDIKALVGGLEGEGPPWTTDWVAATTGIEFDGVRHTAMTDACWVRDVYHSLSLKEKKT